MDDTKKTLLSIDIDTDALIKNVSSAKDAVKALTDQINALKTAGQATGPVFTQLSSQLKTTTTDYTNATNALKDYNAALTNKTKAEQDAATIPPTVPDGPDPNAPVLQAKQTTDIQPDGPITNVAMPNRDFAAEDQKQQADADKKVSDTRIKGVKDYYTAVAAISKTGADSNKSFTEQEIELLDTKNKAYEDSANAFGNVFTSNTIAYKGALIAKKAFGAAEIAMNTETQVSSIISGTEAAVAQDHLVPIIGDVLAAIDIAGGVVRVAATIANGAQQIGKLNSITIPSGNTSTPPKGKARGGIFESDGMGAYLTGPGSGTSDSINARLSNGESVINARSTAMFAPILSAINQAGGGVAFHTLNGGGGYASGGIFSGSNTLNDGSNDLANTRAINNMVKTMATNLPRQVLVVEDVQASLQNKVMLQNMSNF